MESSIEAFTLNAVLIEAIQSGSNCILIGESHNICTGLLPVTNFLLQNREIVSQYNICIFSENYPALGADHLRPFTIQDLHKYEANNLLRPLLIELIKNGVNIHGLETPRTNPFHQFNSGELPWNIESLPRLMDIAKEYQLIEMFETLYKKSIQEFCHELDFDTTLKVLMDIYAVSTRRLVVPNQEFCSLIEAMPKNTLRIIIVGNTHIPRVRTKNSSEVIDDGMENRLSIHPAIQNLVVTALTYDQPEPNQIYTIKEPYCEYDPIRRVSQVEDIDVIYDRFEKNKASEDIKSEKTSLEENPIYTSSQKLPPRLRMMENDEEPELNSEAFEEIDLSPQQDDCCSRCCNL